MQARLQLRYFRATLITVAAVAAVPACFFAIAYADFLSSSWDPSSDSGAIHGYFFIALAAAVACTFSATAFPLGAYYLQARGTYSRSMLFRVLAFSLFIVSFATSLLAALAWNSLALVVPMASIIFPVTALLTLPFTGLWFTLAR
jgi:hypothetical protein